MTERIEAQDILMEARDCIDCVSAAASGPVTTKPKTGNAPAKSVAIIDPIFAAIAEHKRLSKESSHLFNKLYEAEEEASKKHGKRPPQLISWRNFSAIGKSEIKTARNAFLMRPGADPALIEMEYRAAMARYDATEYEGIAWDHRTGVASLRKAAEIALSAENRAATRMARTVPTTPAGAGALVVYIRREVKDDFDPQDWSFAALKTVAAWLAQMKCEAT